MRNRALTGPWAGFSFQGGYLITPEGRAIAPQDLAWLGLTATLAREWRLLMEDERTRVPPRRPAGVVYLRDELRIRRKTKHRGQQDVATAERGSHQGSSPRPAQKRSQRV